MAGCDRDAVGRGRFSDVSGSSFRKLLAVHQMGHVPILPALLSDTFASVLKEAHVAGGIANLVVPVSKRLLRRSATHYPAAAHEIASKPALES